MPVEGGAMKKHLLLSAFVIAISMLLLSRLAISADDSLPGGLVSQGGLWGEKEIRAFIREAQVDEDVKCYRAGLSLLKAGNYGKARDAFSRALSLNRGWKIALYNRALCLEKLGDLKGAAGDYSKALGYNPFNKESCRTVSDVPTHFSLISCLFEVHRGYCRVTHYGRSDGRNRPFRFFFDYSPNLVRPDQATGFKSGDDVAKLDKRYSAESDQQGYGMWTFFLFPSRPAAMGTPNSYTLSYKVTDLPHLHGNTMVSIGSDPIKVLADRWVMVFAFPEGTSIRTMFDLRPYRYEKKGRWMLFYYDYIGVKNPMPLHIGFSLNGDTAEGIDARTLNY